jgi:hypothetical protein
MTYYAYVLEVNTNHTGDYEIYVPIPIVEVANLSELLLANLTIPEGNGDHDLIETQYGIVLGVIGDKNMTLQATALLNYVASKSLLHILSTQVENYPTDKWGDRTYWVYADLSEKIERVLIKVSFTADKIIKNAKGETVRYETGCYTQMEGILTPGWQKIHGRYGVICRD